MVKTIEVYLRENRMRMSQYKIKTKNQYLNSKAKLSRMYTVGHFPAQFSFLYSLVNAKVDSNRECAVGSFLPYVSESVLFLPSKLSPLLP